MKITSKFLDEKVQKQCAFGINLGSLPPDEGVFLLPRISKSQPTEVAANRDPKRHDSAADQFHPVWRHAIRARMNSKVDAYKEIEWQKNDTDHGQRG